ncbi:MAG: hypothetical protein KJ064_01970 [Anaerolineae bacterium]|nr:hypothetical protein [Anaerolineae bacterium]
MGSVERIFIGKKSGDPMEAVTSVRAVSGKGLEGDRYFHQNGSPITLMEAEVLEAIGLSPADSRRNVITRNIALNELVGKDFRIGGVWLRGLALCEPCRHITGQRDMLKQLVHRGGLRAQVLTGGLIKVGAPVY